MITIRSSEGLFEPSLVGIEATIRTPTSVLTLASNGAIVDHTSPFGGGLFGAMSWPRSRFQLATGITLEQQMFLQHDGSGAAFWWELRGGLIPARLTIRAFFSGCDPRSYRDNGFHYEADQDGGRLIWLPRVRGPKIIADTNAEYHDESMRTLLAGNMNNLPVTSGTVVAPGRFEFELGNHPSVLIFSSEGRARTKRDHYVGEFLASLAGRERFETANISRPTNAPSSTRLVEAA